MQKRNYTQLPSLKELEDILSQEAKRAVVNDNHFVEFSPMVQLLECFKLPTNLFTDDYNFADLNELKMDQIESIIQNLVEQILKSDQQANKSVYDKVYDYLSEQDEPKQAGMIFVFGSASDFRIDKAVELYNKGLAKKIVVSGRGPYYENIEITEAQKLAEYAISKGVPESDVVMEDKSITIPDNVKSSLNLIEQSELAHDSIILVNSPFAQRRGWSHFKKFSTAILYRVNSEISEKYDREHWFLQEDTIKVFVNEFVKMKLAVVLNTA